MSNGTEIRHTHNTYKITQIFNVYYIAPPLYSIILLSYSSLAYYTISLLAESRKMINHDVRYVVIAVFFFAMDKKSLSDTNIYTKIHHLLARYLTLAVFLSHTQFFFGVVSLCLTDNIILTATIGLVNRYSTYSTGCVCVVEHEFKMLQFQQCMRCIKCYTFSHNFGQTICIVFVVFGRYIRPTYTCLQSNNAHIKISILIHTYIFIHSLQGH